MGDGTNLVLCTGFCATSLGREEIPQSGPVYLKTEDRLGYLPGAASIRSRPRRTGAGSARGNAGGLFLRGGVAALRRLAAVGHRNIAHIVYFHFFLLPFLAQSDGVGEPNVFF